MSLLGSGENPSHHLLLGDEMINALQQSQQILHITAPFIQHIVGIPRLGKIDQPRRPIDLGVYRLQRHQLADVLLRLLLGQVQQLRETTQLDPRIVLGHDPDIVLDDPLPEILPSLVRLVVSSQRRLRHCIEDIRAA